MFALTFGLSKTLITQRWWKRGSHSNWHRSYITNKTHNQHQKWLNLRTNFSFCRDVTLGVWKINCTIQKKNSWAYDFKNQVNHWDKDGSRTYQRAFDFYVHIVDWHDYVCHFDKLSPSSNSQVETCKTTFYIFSISLVDEGYHMMHCTQRVKWHNNHSHRLRGRTNPKLPIKVVRACSRGQYDCKQWSSISAVVWQTRSNVKLPYIQQLHYFIVGQIKIVFTWKCTLKSLFQGRLKSSKGRGNTNEALQLLLQRLFQPNTAKPSVTRSIGCSRQ